MARRRAQASVDVSDYSARDVEDDFRARDVSEVMDSSYAGEAPEVVERQAAEFVDPRKTVKEALESVGPTEKSGLAARLAHLQPATRAAVTYLVRLARSLTEGSFDSRPIPAEQRAKGIVLVIQILPDGRRVVHR